MAAVESIRLSFASLLGWVISLGILAGGIGIYPAQHFFGLDGLVGGAISGIVVLAVMLVSAGLVIHRASQGPVSAVIAFAVLSIVRLVLCVGLLAVICLSVEFPAIVIIAWAGWLYLAMLAGECIWLTRSLTKDSRFRALEHFEDASAEEKL